MPRSPRPAAADPRPGRKPRPWELAALVGLALTVVLALGLTSFSHTDRSTTASAQEQSRRTEVQALLDRWAAAVQSDDSAALSSILDASASPSFLASETRRARALSGIQFSDWGYEIDDGPGSPVPSSLVDALGADELWSPAVELRYAIAGVDELPTRKHVSLVLARRGDRWTLVSDSATVESGRRTWRGPWDFGPLVSRRVDTGGGQAGPAPAGSASSVVLGHPEDEHMVDLLAAELPAAVANATSLWGTDWPQRALVIVAGSQEEFTSLVGPNHDGQDIAAVATSDAPVPGASTVSGQRIVFSPASVQRLTDITRRSILRHELIHVATRAVTVDHSPMWVLEGYPEYAAYRGSGLSERQIAPVLSAQVAVEGPPNEFPEDEAFFESGERSSAAYETAWSITAFVAAQFGEPRLTELYRALSIGPADAATVDARLSTVLGVDAAVFRDRWSAWVSSHLT